MREATVRRKRKSGTTERRSGERPILLAIDSMLSHSNTSVPLDTACIHMSMLGMQIVLSITVLADVRPLTGEYGDRYLTSR